MAQLLTWLARRLGLKAEAGEDDRIQLPQTVQLFVDVHVPDSLRATRYRVSI